MENTADLQDVATLKENFLKNGLQERSSVYFLCVGGE